MPPLLRFDNNCDILQSYDWNASFVKFYESPLGLHEDFQPRFVKFLKIQISVNLTFPTCEPTRHRPLKLSIFPFRFRFRSFHSSPFFYWSIIDSIWSHYNSIHHIESRRRVDRMVRCGGQNHHLSTHSTWQMDIWKSLVESLEKKSLIHVDRRAAWSIAWFVLWLFNKLHSHTLIFSSIEFDGWKKSNLFHLLSELFSRELGIGVLSWIWWGSVTTYMHALQHELSQWNWTSPRDQARNDCAMFNDISVKLREVHSK